MERRQGKALTEMADGLFNNAKESGNPHLFHAAMQCYLVKGDYHSALESIKQANYHQAKLKPGTKYYSKEFREAVKNKFKAITLSLTTLHRQEDFNKALEAVSERMAETRPYDLIEEIDEAKRISEAKESNLAERNDKEFKPKNIHAKEWYFSSDSRVREIANAHLLAKSNEVRDFFRGDLSDRGLDKEKLKAVVDYLLPKAQSPFYLLHALYLNEKDRLKEIGY